MSELEEPGSDRWVPKVHPTTREILAEDPLELVAEPAPGDPDVMLECLVQEYIWMGWGPEELLGLFHDPEYPVLNQLLAARGEDEVLRRVATILDRWGGFRVTATIAEDPEPEPDEPEVVQISLVPARSDRPGTGGFPGGPV